jgi:hypothetical protein
MQMVELVRFTVVHAQKPFVLVLGYEVTQDGRSRRDSGA